jgi:DNA-binding transcriptional LysR family regulator
MVAFEATARHKSFTLAAKELYLTQSAVSRRVSQLEQFIGHTLIQREYRSISLTVKGQLYAEKISRQLGDISDTAHDLMKTSHPMGITIACASGTATVWLAPRLPDFIKKHPEIKIRLMERENINSLISSEFDVGIYYLRTNPPLGYSSQQVAEEAVYALCSPKYLSGEQIRPEEVMQKTLLVHDEPQKTWMSWKEWLSLCGVCDIKLENTIVANRHAHLLQLALQGQGIILGWNMMMDAFINKGLLVKASDSHAEFGGGYSLIWPDDRMERVPVRQFKKWVVEQIKQQQSHLPLPFFIP